MFAKYKKVIIIVLVVALALILVLIFRGSGSEGDDGLITSTANTVNGQPITGASAIGSEIVEALNQIDALNLDSSIFDDPVFVSLRDKSQPIPPEPVGRENPFAPLERISSGQDQDNIDLQEENPEGEEGEEGAEADGGAEAAANTDNDQGINLNP